MSSNVPLSSVISKVEGSAPKTPTDALTFTFMKCLSPPVQKLEYINALAPPPSKVIRKFMLPG